MPVFTYGHFETNIDPGSELNGYLNEVNEQREYKLIIEKEIVKRGFFQKPNTIYSVYADMGCGEYQVIECAGGSQQAAMAYLLGILSGLRMGRNDNDR